MPKGKAWAAVSSKRGEDGLRKRVGRSLSFSLPLSLSIPVSGSAGGETFWWHRDDHAHVGAASATRSRRGRMWKRRIAARVCMCALDEGALWLAQRCGENSNTIHATARDWTSLDGQSHGRTHAGTHMHTTTPPENKSAGGGGDGQVDLDTWRM